MIKFILFTVLLFTAVAVTAQHHSNQVEFKKQTVKTPRYRNSSGTSNDFNAYNNQRLEPQATIQAPTQNKEVVLECSALMNAKADSYLAIFNLTQQGNTAKEADELLSKRAASFTENLKALGIAATDVYADMIYLIPIYNYEVEKKLFSKTYNEVPKGFEMQKNLHIRFKDASIIDDMVTLASSSEIYDLVTVEYFVKDSKTIYDSLRNKSIQYLAKNIKKFEKLGFNSEKEFRIVSEESGVVYPEGQYSDYDAFVSQSLEAARDKTVATLRKPKTVAYNKLSYEAFDLVINPEFLEPVVQYTYNVKVKFILSDDKLKPNNHYFVIDSTGSLKEITIK